MFTPALSPFEMEVTEIDLLLQISDQLTITNNLIGVLIGCIGICVGVVLSYILLRRW